MLNRDCRELIEDLLVTLNRRVSSLIVSIEVDNLFVLLNSFSFCKKCILNNYEYKILNSKVSVYVEPNHRSYQWQEIVHLMQNNIHIHGTILKPYNPNNEMLMSTSTKIDSNLVSFLEAASNKISNVSSRNREPSSGRSIKYNNKRATRTSVYWIWCSWNKNKFGFMKN